MISMRVIATLLTLRKQVGLAALDFRMASLHLSQFIETSRSYQNTAALLHFFNPETLIISSYNAAPDGMVGLGSLVDRCKNARKVELARGCFDDTKGALMLQNLAAKDTSAILSENYHKQFYLCLGAAAAVLKWIDIDQGYLITKNSLQITFNGSFDHMSIDATSVQNLEIIEPLVLDTNKKKNKRGSLYNVLNTTKTVGGQKEGLTDPAANIRRSQALISAVILLKNALDVLPVLSEVLQNATSSLLCNVRTSLCSHSAYSVLKDRIVEVIEEDAMHARSAFASRTEQCFAVKYGVDGMLDLARRTFCTTSAAISKLGEKYQKEFDLPKLKLVYNQRHGFHIVITELDLQEKSLPKSFVQVTKRGKSFCCSTDELMSLNKRNQEAAAECYKRTGRCLEDLAHHIRKDIRYLALLSESLSLLDMMVNSFATLVITRLPATYVRPEFSENGPIAIEAGRHPVLESIHPEEYVPNNTFMAESTNLVIVTGPNMSGKSTYLRQVTLITIMAHIGCYVPASFASFRIVDHVFTRIGTGDNLELNSSTFMAEMKETAFILQNLNDRSLIIIDELGRGTSTSDGLAIAWSSSEYLLSLKAYTIFATHMERLGELATLYPNVKTCFLTVDIVDKRLDFKYLLKEGQTNCPHYGLTLAEISGFPSVVVENARRITARLQEKEKLRLRVGQHKFQSLRKEYHVAQRLFYIQYSNMTEATLRNYLQTLKDSYLRNDM
ncbi:hypothetical protein R1flu_019496 [Riccia fluitans]|uniref:DNA mismatch repair proteins mutS family domain-containing protein n=1 Tax=Riccia fluitans TaxID=41844 RepID=A0ABD1ZIU9_9MARC